MSIEKALERIADAFERIANVAESMDNEATTAPEKTTPPAGKKGASKKGGKKKEEDTPPAADGATEDELRSVFQEYVGRKGSEEGTAKLKELIEGYGASKIGDLKEKDYDAIIKKVKSWK